MLISGGTGAFGSAFARYLLEYCPPKRLVIYSRSEYKQFQMQQELAPLDKQQSLRFMIGDIRDRPRLRRALRALNCSRCSCSEDASKLAATTRLR